MNSNKNVSLRTDKPNWQSAAWELAKSNKGFTIERVCKKHLPFIEALLAAYKYETAKIHANVIFIPCEADRRRVYLQPARLWRYPNVKRLSVISPILHCPVNSFKMVQIDNVGAKLRRIATGSDPLSPGLSALTR